MAGIRCGVAMGRPDLLAKLHADRQNQMPVTSVAAANASLAEPDLVPTRKKIIGDNRRETLAGSGPMATRWWASRKSNCFMHHTGRAAHRRDRGMHGEKRLYRPGLAGLAQCGADHRRHRRRHVQVPVAFKKVMDAPPVKVAARDLDMRAPKTAEWKTFLS